MKAITRAMAVAQRGGGAVPGQVPLVLVDSREIKPRDVAPPGWAETVKKLKRHREITNPFALAWWMRGKGFEPGG